MLSKSISKSSSQELCNWSFIARLQSMEQDRLLPGFSGQILNRDTSRSKEARRSQMSGLSQSDQSRQYELLKNIPGVISPEDSYYNREFFSREMEARGVAPTLVATFYAETDRLTKQVKSLLDTYAKSVDLEGQRKLSETINQFITQTINKEQLKEQFKSIAKVSDSDIPKLSELINAVDVAADTMTDVMREIVDQADDSCLTSDNNDLIEVSAF